MRDSAVKNKTELSTVKEDSKESAKIARQRYNCQRTVAETLSHYIPQGKCPMERVRMLYRQLPRGIYHSRTIYPCLIDRDY